eukprot:CAMPEP_0170135572 /NCGR_PEP_ID=MMETSP0033_2-20121228/2547_1 /TAXON_ID=195969 /ORGANISM="Dolichomastix tenuilepis, Strain CCMP3274" /LENGTH=182 /DNA_ID=CAMNT_0010371173 /DNA_START=52 /DNA_END=600 /DNA_ORIENTATION=+
MTSLPQPTQQRARVVRGGVAPARRRRAKTLNPGTAMPEDLFSGINLTLDQKERCFQAAYNCPYAGLSCSPYRGARFAEMDSHILKQHRSFEHRAKAALGEVLTPASFASGVRRLQDLLGVPVEVAVEEAFAAPALIGLGARELARGLLRLKSEAAADPSGEDVSALVRDDPARLVRAANQQL